MKYKIVSDSSANLFALPANIAGEGIGFAHVPLKIITTAKEYSDDPGLDIGVMTDEIRATKGKSGTSCPNTADWVSAFGDAENIFVVTITSNLSGSYSTAVRAAEDYAAEHGVNIHVIDSLSTGPEMRLIIERLVKLIGEGREFNDIVKEIRKYQVHTHLLFSLESLTNLARNGRVNPAVAKLAGILGIRLVAVASGEGTIAPLHKCRGERKAMEVIFEEMKARGFKGGAVRIAHCFNEGAVETLSEIIKKYYPRCEIISGPCTALCSFYAERGGILVGFEDAL